MSPYSNPVFCASCNQTVQNEQKYVDHVRGKSHIKNVRYGLGWKERRNEIRNQRGLKGKGIVIPRGTAFLIEQEALHKDAVTSYVLSLYERAALRSRL